MPEALRAVQHLRVWGKLADMRDALSAMTPGAYLTLGCFASLAMTPQQQDWILGEGIKLEKAVPAA